jgi:hypothetical protein
MIKRSWWCPIAVCDEAGAAQQRCDAVDGALMVCGVRVVLGVEPRDQLDRFFDMDRKDRRRGVRFRHSPSSARDAV